VMRLSSPGDRPTSRRALVYATYNGVFSNTNGIGRQTKTFLATVARHRGRLESVAGPFDVHVVAPVPIAHRWGFCADDLAYARSIVDSARGKIHFCPAPRSIGPFWSVASWEALSAGAAAVTLDLATAYDDVVVIAIDPPFLKVGSYLEDASSATPTRIRTVLAPFSTALISERPSPSPHRVAWELAAIQSANRLPSVFVADIARVVTTQLTEVYGLSLSRLLPYPASVDTDGADGQPLALRAALDIAAQFEVPLDRPVILSFSRADPNKGFETLIDATVPLRDGVHLVLVAVPGSADDITVVDDYRRRAAAAGIRATIVGRYTRELPRALCRLPQTRAVACPYRGDTLANVPFEVALWAREDGPIVIGLDQDGLREQVESDRTGILYAPDTVQALTTALTHALSLDASKRTAMRLAAHAKVIAERSASESLSRLIAHVWGSAAMAQAANAIVPSTGESIQAEI
jgi:glycosyltransferase involved in cell wall biosynthesis